MMNFTAIDFETATSARDSACSVAVVEVRDGRIADSYYTLIRPPFNRYHWFNTKIHGIHRRDTADKPDFAMIWPFLEERLEGRLIVAHNANFDMSVLKSCLYAAKLPLPHLSYCDTVAISRRVWPDLVNHKLDTVSHFLNINFHHHHALDDARACAAIPVCAGRAEGAGSLEELAHKLDVPLCPLL